MARVTRSSRTPSSPVALFSGKPSFEVSDSDSDSDSDTTTKKVQNNFQVKADEKVNLILHSLPNNFEIDFKRNFNLESLPPLQGCLKKLLIKPAWPPFLSLFLRMCTIVNL